MVGGEKVVSNMDRTGANQELWVRGSSSSSQQRAYTGTFPRLYINGKAVVRLQYLLQYDLY